MKNPTYYYYYYLFQYFWTDLKFSEGGSALMESIKHHQLLEQALIFRIPTLVVNKFDGEDINFYISNGGFFQEKTESVFWGI